MENKKSFSRKLEAFFAGKGFYIVLVLCVAVIGVSAWSMLSGRGTDVDGTVSNVSEAAAKPQVTPAPTPKAAAPSAALVLPTEALAEEGPAALEEVPLQQTWAEETPPAPVFVWPLEGEIEMPYSVESLVYNKTMADWRTHDGIDIAGEIGTHVLAAASGVVENVYTDDLYGVTVEISHPGGLKSIYCNLAGIPTVKAGDSVTAGEIIGAVGNTALAETGEVYHLHFAMARDGERVDPADYLPAR